MDGCWFWNGSYSTDGYGRAYVPARKRDIGAHRLAYELLVGPIPEGLQLDHLCRVRSCVNPEHLRPVTCRENVFAAGSRCVQAKNAAKTHCPQGHAFDAENTWIHSGRRFCRSCRRAADRVRGHAKATRVANNLKTHCDRGHLFDDSNTYRTPAGRMCRECANARRRASRISASGTTPARDAGRSSGTRAAVTAGPSALVLQLVGTPDPDGTPQRDKFHGKHVRHSDDGAQGSRAELRK